MRGYDDSSRLRRCLFIYVNVFSLVGAIGRVVEIPLSSDSARRLSDSETEFSEVLEVRASFNPRGSHVATSIP
jgi:hypothetical protein